MPFKSFGDLGPNPDGTHGCPNCGAAEGQCDCMPPTLDDTGAGIDGAMPEEMGGENCPECGAPPDMPHDPGCPNNEEMGADPDRFREATGFDKYMDVTLIKEARSHGVDAKTPSPQRQIARKYQEHPLGKIRMGSR